MTLVSFLKEIGNEKSRVEVAAMFVLIPRIQNEAAMVFRDLSY